MLSEILEKFIPYTVVMNKNTTGKTPDFNPQIADKNFWEDIRTQLAGSSQYNGLSTQTQKGLLELDQQYVPPVNQVTPPTPQTMKSTRGMVQLPNGQFVTQEQYQQLLLRLRNR